MRQFFANVGACIYIFLLCSTGVHAQTSLGSQPDPIKFTIAPEVPGPNQLVSIEAQGVGSLLGDATITWRLNSKTVLSGIGERIFTFTTGGLGAQSLVEITIVTSDGKTIQRNFSFIPSVVNLLWEADTTMPPFFAGKALYSAGSRLTVTAFPVVIANGRTITSNNFSFQWLRNGAKVTAQSGIGRNSFTFDGDQLLSEERIGVDVYLEGTLVGRSTVTIPATRPLLALYYRDPLRGVVYDSAITSIFSLSAAEATVQAQPYYFSSNSAANNALAFTWTINGSEVTGPYTAEGVLTLRQTGSGAGEGRLGIQVQNMESSKFIQAAQTSLRILFGQQSNSGIQSLFGI